MLLPVPFKGMYSTERLNNPPFLTSNENSAILPFLSRTTASLPFVWKVSVPFAFSAFKTTVSFATSKEFEDM